MICIQIFRVTRSYVKHHRVKKVGQPSQQQQFSPTPLPIPFQAHFAVLSRHPWSTTRSGEPHRLLSNRHRVGALLLGTQPSRSWLNGYWSPLSLG
ncbi:hypothetical protein HanIR_Chr17g0851831 [Helianthus annuus]|nr:hypothetical protein HanIR_Chr17g0851831 [Helianthus annuus]